MTLYNKALFTSLHTWPSELVQALPELLGELLKQHRPPSLERMQLVTIDLKLLDAGHDKTGALSWGKKLLIKKPDQFLALNGTLHKDSKPLLEITIDYFLRGQRQFFRHAAPPELGNSKTLPAITADDIHSFFTSISQNNDFFTNADLALLNGLPCPPVPSQMLLAMLINHALLELPLAQRFTIHFYQALPQNTPLLLTSQKSVKHFSFCIGTTENSAAALVLSE